MTPYKNLFHDDEDEVGHHTDEGASALDAFDIPIPNVGGRLDARSDLDDLPSGPPSNNSNHQSAAGTLAEHAGLPDFQFTVADPSNSVIVTALLSGTVERIGIGPRAVSAFTEQQLADEIIATARVAASKARSAEYEILSEILKMQGQDQDSIRYMLQHSVGLPTPEQAIFEESQFTSERIRDRD